MIDTIKIEVVNKPVKKADHHAAETIIAAARTLSRIIWCLLSMETPFDPSLIIDRKPNRKANSMKRVLGATA